MSPYINILNYLLLKMKMRRCKNCGKPTTSKKGYCQRTIMCNYLNRKHGKNIKKQDKGHAKTNVSKKQRKK